LGTLRSDDRFRMIDFSSDVRTFRDDYVAATPANVREAQRYLDALEANGGTNIEGALREALRPPTVSGRLPLVLFVTDGEPTVGDRNADHLAAMASDAPGRGPTRRIFTFGLGSDVNVSLLEQLALDGRGTAQFVRPEESVERTVGLVADRLVDPILTDVRVRVDGDVRLEKALPSGAADVFADRDLVVLARYTGHGQARVVVDGNQRGTPVEFRTTVDFPDRDRQNAFVARLWAAQRIGFLDADKRKNGDSNELDEEIRMLGERYGIPTEFTSYLVTEPQLAGSTWNSPRPALESVRSTGADVRAVQFEVAKQAAAQRSVGSLASLDSMSSAARAGIANAASTRAVEGHTFELRDSVWTDARYSVGMTAMAVTKIKPYSAAYFDVLQALPELRDVLALGTHVIAVGRTRAISISDDGAADISSAALAALAAAW
ncbi:MAG TPA: hypothetical protein VHV78_01110, partial [Gemmatimonadaceae bacterium]|nr:hypothetical protein [Gemmatimonadaceae bacterium]